MNVVKALRNTQFFDEVRLNPEMTNIPGRRDLGITVQEGRTGVCGLVPVLARLRVLLLTRRCVRVTLISLTGETGFRATGKVPYCGSVGSSSNQILISLKSLLFDSVWPSVWSCFARNLNNAGL